MFCQASLPTAACSEGDDLPPAGAAAVTNLEVVELGLERFDGAVRHLEIFVEAVAFLDELHRQSVS